MRLFVVEPHLLRRQLICESIAATVGLTLVGETSSLEEVRDDTRSPAIFLVNASIIQEELPSILRLERTGFLSTLLLFGTRPNLEALLDSIDLPVAGFLTFNHLSQEDFSRSLQIVANGGVVIEPYTAQLLIDYVRRRTAPQYDDSSAAANLTDREHEVLSYVRQGLSNKEIAYRMVISLGTVRSHLRSIFRKLDVSSRAGAAVLYRPRPHEVRAAS